MDKIHKLVLGLIPNQACNLKCEYCYISQLEAWDPPEKMKYTPSYIAKALSKERLGGVSLINLTGNGETLIQPEIVELIKCLLEEGHYVEVVTNGTLTKRINEILKIDSELLKHLFFKVSFHFKELKRLNIMDEFFANVRNIKDSNASFTLELMAYDGIENDIEEIKRVSIENTGAICQSTVGRNERKDADLLSQHSKEEYKKIWSSLDSPMLDFKLEVLGKKRKEFCYAGKWSIFVNLYTGEAQPCYWQPYNQNIFDNLDDPILFEPVGHHCTQPFCINAHSHMAWGIIPEIDTPSYNVIRNRKAADGSEWVKDECKEFFNTKLVESNEEFSTKEKYFYTITYPFRMVRWFFKDKNNIKRVKKHLKRVNKWKKNENK